MIPRTLVRVVPEYTSVDVEQFWATANALHPSWRLVTYRDPLDPADFPITGALWGDYTKPGAQIAGLVRLEVLAHYGGVYVDSDVELFRALDPLLGCEAFAAYEDSNTVPDAVLGFEPNHPAVLACLELAVARINSGSTDWRTGSGPWATGPGVTTTVLPGRADVLLLPPGSFYPYHYSEKHRRHDDHQASSPWAFGAHHWHGSWLIP